MVLILSWSQSRVQLYIWMFVRCCSELEQKAILKDQQLFESRIENEIEQIQVEFLIHAAQHTYSLPKSVPSHKSERNYGLKPHSKNV